MKHVVKLLCTLAAGFCIFTAVSFASITPVQAKANEVSVLVIGEGVDTEEEVNKEQELRTGILYLMPSVVIAITLTIIVMRQKRENREREGR